MESSITLDQRSYFQPIQRKLILLAGLGGLLEFYDFIIYALFASYIAHEFFPTGNNITSLLATFATFSIGYLARPIGGIVFGHFGDKYGRKKTFTISIFIMALATFLVGVVPSYQKIGMLAPVILIILRLAQGFSIGGEIPGAITYISESNPRREGVATGLIFCLLQCGMIVASLIHILLNMTLTQDQISTWGWRLPFFIGGLLGLLSYRARKQFYESPQFQQIQNSLQRFPLKEVFLKNWRGLVRSICLTSLIATNIILLFIFIPSYLTTILHYPTGSVTGLNTLTMCIASSLTVVFGWFGDNSSKRQLVLILSILTLVLGYPIFALFVGHKVSLFIPMFCSSVLVGLASGVVPSILAETFETQIRYSGIGFAYNLSFAIFGGLTPVLATALIHSTNSLHAPAYILIFTGLLGLIGVGLLPRSKNGGQV